MRLSRLEREKITDSVLKIQSVRAAIREIDESKIPAYAELQNCLKAANTNLRLALGEEIPG